MTLEQIWLFVGAVVLGIAVVHFLVTRPRERKRQNEGLPHFTTFRLLLAAVAAGVALFSGGCSLYLLSDLWLRGPQKYLDWEVVAIIGGIPFLIASIVWWLSMRRNKPET